MNFYYNLCVLKPLRYKLRTMMNNLCEVGLIFGDLDVVVFIFRGFHSITPFGDIGTVACSL
jgi:hypothetical protein